MDENRRTFLKSLALGMTVLMTPVIGLTKYFQKKRLRPPCALDEKDLLASCIKCGQCIQVCPVKALKPGTIEEGFGVGVPFIDARKQACDFSCDVIQCALACPTGALSYHKNPALPVRPGAKLSTAPVLLAKVGEPDASLNMTERMGVAKLTRPQTCLAMQGLGFKGVTRGSDFKGIKRYAKVDRWKPSPVAEHEYEESSLCDLCVKECPIQGAITLEVKEVNGKKIGQPQITDKCVGCGLCEMVCPTEQASIEVDIRGVWS